MNRKFLYPLLVVIITIVLYYRYKDVDVNSDSSSRILIANESFSTSEFSENDAPTSTTGVIIKHEYFSLSYSETHEQAEWVAYELLKKHLSKNEIERPYFIDDPSVKTKSADWQNYKNSGYDRGHLCPAGDRRFSSVAYNETFFTSNISPQDHQFNAGIWNRLEQKARFWADKFDGVYVVTGPVLKEGLNTIGTEHVSVPEEFYKIIVDVSNGNYKALAFLIPNEPSNNSFYDFVVPIDFIEEKTRIDFFPNLSESIELRMEATVDLKLWAEH